MKQILIAAASVLVSVGVTFADSGVSTPNAGVAPPAPVVRAAPTVEVFPFAQIGDAAKADWIGRGLQENLQNDVSHTGAMLMIAPAGPDAAADPVAIAKKNGATLAVSGTYQIVDDQVRVNGRLLDTANGNVVGSFASTGQQKDLFKVEDALGEQLRRLLPLPAGATAVTAQTNTQVNTLANTPPQQAVSSPAVIYSQPETVTNLYTATPAPYYYPDSFYYGYAYPYDYYPIDFGFYGGGIYGGIGFFPGYYGHGFAHRGGSFYHGGGGAFHGGGSFHGGGGFHVGGGFHGGGGRR